MDTRIIDNGDKPQKITVEGFVKHLNKAATVWLATIGNGDIIRQMTCRGETINVTTGDLQTAAGTIERLKADRDNWEDQAQSITASIIEKAKSMGHDGFYSQCPSELLTDVANQFEDKNAQMKAVVDAALIWADTEPNIDATEAVDILDNAVKAYRAATSNNATDTD